VLHTDSTGVDPESVVGAVVGSVVGVIVLALRLAFGDRFPPVLDWSVLLCACTDAPVCVASVEDCWPRPEPLDELCADDMPDDEPTCACWPG
jgi:hypothetical protein